MRIIVVFILGLAVGAAVVWLLGTSRGRSALQDTAVHVDQAARSAGAELQEKLRGLNLRPEDIKDELARGGQVVRRKAQEAGQAIANATADARATAAIKAKLLAHRELSAFDISVNTTAGVVTLSGMVGSREEIGKAMLLAMETEGVREVISTLQIKPRDGQG